MSADTCDDAIAVQSPSSPRPTRAGRSVLLTTTTRGAAVSAISASIVVGQRRRSVDDDERQRRDLLRAPRAVARLRPRSRRRASRRPAVSTSVIGRPPMSTRSVSRSRVVPGTSVTIARAAPTSALNRLDLPAFGRPDDHDQPAFAHHAAGAAVARERDRARRATRASSAAASSRVTK